MTILKNKLFLFGVCVFGLTSFGGSTSLKAASVDTATNGEIIASTSASDEDKEAEDVDKATAADSDQDTIRDTEDAGVNKNDVNFDYFLTSCYVADNVSNIPAVGKVTGSTELDGSITTAKSLYVVVPNDKLKLEPGEKLIVFGDVGALREKNSGFNKRLIKNLAILQVREGEGRRYLTDVVTVYDEIPVGSPVKLYSGEETVWEKTQVAKESPNHPIKCYVAGGERGRESWNQTDYVILTAGAKQGVVEGLIFQLWEIPWSKNVKLDGVCRGFAKVFYVGGNYSIARIQEGSGSISAGFEALYQP